MYTNAVGRRKRAIARVYLKTGSGTFVINRRGHSEYLANELLEIKVNQPFAVSDLDALTFDIKVNVNGGGPNGQAEAIRLAISRALEKHQPELRPALKKAGLLSVDARKVERKKYGLRKARRRSQFSKR